VAGLYDRREDNGETKLDERFLSTLYDIVDKQPTDFGYPRPTWTQELLAKVMEKLTEVKVHPGTMSRALKLIKARLGRPKPTVGCPWSEAAKKGSSGSRVGKSSPSKLLLFRILGSFHAFHEPRNLA
jgi:hypothetical protein